MLLFVTGNTFKINHARLKLTEHSIFFKEQTLPIIEIQSTSIEKIATQKAKDAFAELRTPLLIQDDGWFIEGLNGFPGPFMRYTNEWLTTQDYINLLKDKKNKKVIFQTVVCYIDKDQIKIFSEKIPGRVLDKPQGKALPFMELCTFRKDGKSMALCINEGVPEFDENAVWDQFAAWYLTTRR